VKFDNIIASTQQFVSQKELNWWRWSIQLNYCYTHFIANYSSKSTQKAFRSVCCCCQSSNTIL